MQRFLFDKEIVNNQLSVLNNTLEQQRQTKKTLLSYLEKFSNAMYENFNSDNTNSLLSLINEAHSVFACIKSNINKTLELKNFLENISKSNFLNSIDSEKFNNEFNILLENISKTNSNYLTFMNNYEKFITPQPTIEKDNSSSEETIQENDSAVIEENVIDNDSVLDEDEPLFENNNTSDEETIQENDSAVIEENVIDNDSVLDEDEPLFENNNTSDEETIQENDSATIEEQVINNETIIDNEFIEESSNYELNNSLDLIEKALIINRKTRKAILPYTISDLDNLFLNDPEKYSSIQDIIDKEYTISLDDFENTSISRYKEAFKLAKDKSNYTFSQAANFAKDLLIESKITTLIIAACKNIDELNSYIECLRNNELEKFECFKIIEK